MVDDDRDVLEALESRLMIAGYNVIACASYIHAKDHLVPGFEGCVVTDIRMPGKTGLDLIARANAVDPELPVIVLTGFAETETVVRAMREGAVTVLEKPCPMEMLIETIAEALARRGAVLKLRKSRVKRAVAGRPPKDRALSPQLAEYEAELVRRALKRNDGNKAKTAQELGISRSQLYAKIKILGL
ncbi:response regulator [Tritonibacter multivorans]|uniref:response regulator n=1 Tax=Tritonibacter multivorans TaxID=928856 RepID=UPI0013F4CDCA|nr:response regulator [Tritonibacter multivorans]MDA7421955.1 response regulator [Tritonibacter multivorans]